MDVQWLVGKLRVRRFKMVLAKSADLTEAMRYKPLKLAFRKGGVSFSDHNATGRAFVARFYYLYLNLK